MEDRRTANKVSVWERVGILVVFCAGAAIATPAQTFTMLHSFCSQTNCTDGESPNAGLAQGTNGKLYGTTVAGGAGNDGMVFSISPSGALTRLHSFDGTDGTGSFAGVIQGANGKFYGTTMSGGANSGSGTIFSITTEGTLTTLYNFCSQTNCPDGLNPIAGLVQDTNGSFYGTTVSGGKFGEGTVFSLSVGLGPFVGTNPISGVAGVAAAILGTNLTGATSVTFNGTAATFAVKSKAEITTTVPTGATTGTVQVVTPGGTLTSNVPFRVQ